MITTTLLREYRYHRMAKFTFWVLLYGIAIKVSDLLQRQPGGFLEFLFWAAFIPCVIYYLFRLLGYVRHRLLWRLSRRILVTYVFIAIVPILLILTLVGLGVFIVNGQLGAYLVSQKLRNQYDELKQLNRAVVHSARPSATHNSTQLIDEIERFYTTGLIKHTKNYPGLTITVWYGTEARSFHLDGSPANPPVTIPGWFHGDEFAGVVTDNGKIHLRAIDRDVTPRGSLTLILSMPVSPQLLDKVGMGVGPVTVYTLEREPAGTAQFPSNPSLPGMQTPGRSQPRNVIQSDSVPMPRQVAFWDIPVYGASSVEPVEWNGAPQQQRGSPTLIGVNSQASILTRQLLNTLGEFSQVPVVAFVVVSIFLLVIELVALIIGIQLTRSITTTVDKLYAATEKVKAGDFSHRIYLPAHDQVSALGEAFDNMTASVERLLLESREKSRLDRELQIAREVQSQLFPQHTPDVKGLQLRGICKPARVVSGDYFDFLPVGSRRMGLILGDISGKGISAALLMAAIQSSLHALYYDFNYSTASNGVPALSPAEVVERLNRQVYDSTPVEKYATFFFSIYDEATRQLTYTNAGHPPPFLFRGHELLRLEEGGTVVGLFKTMAYRQGIVTLHPGDVLLAFTDGMVEPENSFGEEFGEQRLIEAARRGLQSPPDILLDEIYRAVAEWTGSPELQDDMTMIYARAVES
jgi:sigma-B regulation protein RsbU (phosphoserine phosphatase)